MKVNSIDEFASNNVDNLVLKMKGKTDIKDKVISANLALNSMVKRFQGLKWHALLLKFFQTFPSQSIRLQSHFWDIFSRETIYSPICNSTLVSTRKMDLLF